MKDHFGARILEPVIAHAEVIPIVLQPHERFEGGGYPDGRSGEAISLGARIFAVADCLDALICDRPSRRNLERVRLITLIEEGSGTQFEPKVVEPFLQAMASEEEGSPPKVEEYQLGLGVLPKQATNRCVKVSEIMQRVFFRLTNQEVVVKRQRVHVRQRT